MREGDREGTHRTNTTQSPFAPLVFLLANPTVKQSCRGCENPRLSFLPLEEEAFATTFTGAEHKGTSPLCSLALSRPVDSFLSKKFHPPRSSKGSRRECTNWRRRRQIDSFLLLLLLLLRHLVRYSARSLQLWCTRKKLPRSLGSTPPVVRRRLVDRLGKAGKRPTALRREGERLCFMASQLRCCLLCMSGTLAR